MAPTRPEKVNRVKVKISGEEYTIKTEASTEHVEKVAALVDKRLKEAARALPTVPMHRLAIFVALNLADELVRREERDAAAGRGAGRTGADQPAEPARPAHQPGQNVASGNEAASQRGPGTPLAKTHRERFKNPVEDRL